ncbi:phage portal protein [Pasteurellaceae bacterium 22721_9_1]
MNFNQDSYSDALGLNEQRNKNNVMLDFTRYELGGLFANVVDIPADAAVSRSIELENDENDVLLYELERLAFLPQIANAVRWSRLFGGAALVLITDDGLLNEPLNTDRMTKISELRVFGLDQITPTSQRYLDPKKSNFGQYQSYFVQLNNAQVEIHESRMLFVSGDALPEKAKNGIHWKGRAVTRVFEKIAIYENSLHLSNEILRRKQQPVHRMKGLATAIANGLEDSIRSRVSMVEKARNSLNAVVVDQEDDYTIINADLGGVVDILDELKVAISADTKIPVSILFGQSAKGMNATGENDIESFYDLIEGIQQNKIKPVLEKLLELIALQKHVKANNDWSITFPSLKTPTDAEIANVEKVKADTKAVETKRLLDLVDAGALSNDELRDLHSEELNLKGAADEDSENTQETESVVISNISGASLHKHSH